MPRGGWPTLSAVLISLLRVEFRMPRSLRSKGREWECMYDKTFFRARSIGSVVPALARIARTGAVPPFHGPRRVARLLNFLPSFGQGEAHPFAFSAKGCAK